MALRILGFLFFLTTFSTVYGGMNYYVYHNIIQGFSKIDSLATVVGIIFWIFGSAYLVGQLLKPRLYIPLLSYLGALWMGLLSISFTVFLIKDIILWFFPSEQNFYLLSLLSIFFLVILSVVNVKKGPKIKKVAINHGKLKKEPLTIAHLSDIHLGIMTCESWLNQVVEQVNSIKADLVVITGDMVDDSFSKVEKFVPIMKNIKSKYGVFAIAGNHEYYQGIDNFQKFCREANIKELNDEALVLAERINLIGLSDKVALSNRTLEKQLVQILQGCDHSLYNILLLHKPVGFKLAAKLGIDLQLSGHTHGGQLPPLNIVVSMVFRYAYGLYTYNGSHIYTSPGTGTWGPPMRLFSESEIVSIQIN